MTLPIIALLTVFLAYSDGTEEQVIRYVETIEQCQSAAEKLMDPKVSELGTWSSIEVTCTKVQAPLNWEH